MRQVVSMLVFLGLLLAVVSIAEDKDAAHPVYSQKLKLIDGRDVNLAKYRGKVLLIVNTASQCGATPQYAALQMLYEKYQDKGLAVAGFPCNQFGEQEPGTAEEIQQFCQKNYGVKFDLFAKIDVNGPQAAPLFQYLTSKESGLKDQGQVQWNFEKFLIDRQGKVIARFRTPVEPDAPEVLEAIEAALN